MKKIVIKKDWKVSPNGIEIISYTENDIPGEGEAKPLNEELVELAVSLGVAEYIDGDEKRIEAAPKNKSVKAAPKNKSE